MITAPREVAVLDNVSKDGAGPKVRQASFESEAEAKAIHQVESALNRAETAYSDAYEMVDAPTEAAVDAFYDAAVSAWLAMTASAELSAKSRARAQEIYHSSLVKFIQFVEEFGRRDPVKGILIKNASGDQWIPVQTSGFDWESHDIHDLLLTEPHSSDSLGDHHVREGIGVPLVGLHYQTSDPFLLQHSAFPVTCVLHVSESPSHVDSEPLHVVCELLNPRKVANFQDLEQNHWELAADFTAHWEWYMENTKTDAIYGFRHPDASGNDVRLLMMEPYQPGKIPLVFVHGLLSDPSTWIALANAFEEHGMEFFDHYQLLVFQYPTGKSFLTSANDFRIKLAQLFEKLWLETEDPSLFHTVLVGHSMGGLLSRFQVTESQDRVWQAFSDANLNEIRLGVSSRKQLESVFFFEPSRFVERVVFVATPHNGSHFAEISIGKLATLLVQRKTQRSYERLLAKNPGKIKDHFEGRLPTSTDLLVPNNPILQALNQLDFSPRVHLHSIIGTGQFMFGATDTDGVVPVTSARIPGVESEILVEAKHSGIQHHPDTVNELMRILSLHWKTTATQVSRGTKKRNGSILSADIGNQP